jgi:hypothetical protein
MLFFASPPRPQTCGRGVAGPGRIPGAIPRNPTMRNEQHGNTVIQEILIFVAIVATIFALA